MPARLHLVTEERTDAEESVLDAVFSALADPVRRAILMHLEGGELLVSQIAGHFDISLQAVSRHIQVLVRAGLVKQERTGRISRCRLDTGPIFTAAVWLNRYSKYWQAKFDTLALWLDEIERRKEAGRGSARRRASATTPTTPRSSASSRRPAASRTTRTSGGTSACTRASARSRSGSVMPLRRSRMPSRWPRSARRW